MALNKLDEQKNTAAAWCFGAAVLIPLAFGLWRGWPGPWWTYVVTGLLIFVGCLGGWVQATQQRDIHTGTMELRNRERDRDKSGS